MNAFKLILVMTLLFPTIAFSRQCHTNGGYFACMTEDQFSTIARAANQGDNATAMALISRGVCIILRDGLQVTKLSGGGWGVKKVSYKGVTMFTNSEAISCR